MNIADKYYWIMNHPKYVPFGQEAVIEITPHMVCPETNRIEDLALLNTKLRFWVELMTPYEDEENNQLGYSHDWELDCGGDTWEEAVEALYLLVQEKYGDYNDEDLDNQRLEYLEDMKVKVPGYRTIFDDLMEGLDHSAKGPDLTTPVKKLLDFEIEGFKEDIEHFELLLPVLEAKLSDPNLTMQEYSDVELQITCIDHDLEVAKLSLHHGYDVEVYGIRDENSETGEHSNDDAAPKSI